MRNLIVLFSVLFLTFFGCTDVGSILEPITDFEVNKVLDGSGFVPYSGLLMVKGAILNHFSRYGWRRVRMKIKIDHLTSSKLSIFENRNAKPAH